MFKGIEPKEYIFIGDEGLGNVEKNTELQNLKKAVCANDEDFSYPEIC